MGAGSAGKGWPQVPFRGRSLVRLAKRPPRRACLFACRGAGGGPGLPEPQGLGLEVGRRRLLVAGLEIARRTRDVAATLEDEARQAAVANRPPGVQIEDA